MNEIEIFRLIGAISRQATTAINQKVKQLGLDNNLFLYLLRIIETEGLNQQELAQKVKVDKTTLSRALAKLEKQGYITKEASQSNKKFNELFPTEKAKGLYNQIFSLERNYIAQAFSEVSPLDRADLYRILEKIQSSMT
ncbi:MarR family winged helix-turn-helix transcriptional regulator [Enterococcus sp. HY326]|uniref:MarR family winged helix-turn-helix transcriptional regulator n=1 Tax=Enterococcus sp. HY326 TaxID=2971265 RepID=UPI00223EE7D5|nr:MarR family transcriptional regulator [Enterococcus sp. HY326]